ncbi:hypothetical protein A2U01_0082213, partial [Trifolium medium]|nr:hypothetical protein [Trifolium medium]
AVSQHDGAIIARWQVSEAIVIRWSAMGDGGSASAQNRDQVIK